MLEVLIWVGKIYLGVTLGAGAVAVVLLLVLRDYLTGRAGQWTA